MNSNIDFTTFELGLARPKLRDDLRFTLHESRQGSWYVIEDETNSKFYRIGQAEYVFLSWFDGETTVQTAIARTAAELGATAFSEADAAALCKWLVDADLATKERLDKERLTESQQKRFRARRMQWLNPIMLKVPLGNPNRFYGGLARVTGWLFSWPVAVAWAAVCLLAMILFLSHADQWRSTAPVYARDNWIWLASTWLMLRVVHESAHAVSCRRFGGSVREWGILLLMFIPLPYVDVTSAWRFPQTSRRILTSAAGVLAELFVAALAVLAWCQFESPAIRQAAMNVIFAASVTTLLFNANPLMRFDGYHILADWLDVPNLWTHGRQYVRGLGRRFFLGLPAQNPPWSLDRAVFTRVYGIASFVWMILIFASLTLTTLGLLEGIGLVLALIATTLWLGIPAMRLVRFLKNGTATERPNRKRFALSVSITVAGFVLFGILAPAPSVVSAPVVIEHDPLVIVRNRTAGFVLDVEVTVGQQISRGDVICRLENKELQSQLAEAKIQLKESRLRVRAHKTDGNPGAVQFELEATVDLEKRVSELEQMATDLTLRSPAPGRVLVLDVDEHVGTHVDVGSEIASIGNPQNKIAIALVPQDEIQPLAHTLGAPARLRIWGEYGGTLRGRVRKTNPRAQTSLPHFAFAVPAGGPLAVVANDSDQGQADGDRADWRLVTPHVQVEIELTADDVRRVAPGQTGMLLVRARDESMGSWALSSVWRHLRSRISRTHGL